MSKKMDPRNEALAEFVAKRLGCDPDDVAADCMEVNPRWKQMGTRVKRTPFPHKYYAQWLNGVLAIFKPAEFAAWLLNLPRSSVREWTPDVSQMRVPEFASHHVFRYCDVFKIRHAGPSCGLILMEEVTEAEILDVARV
jgi:hypothetical protein